MFVVVCVLGFLTMLLLVRDCEKLGQCPSPTLGLMLMCRPGSLTMHRLVRDCGELGMKPAPTGEGKVRVMQACRLDQGRLLYAGLQCRNREGPLERSCTLHLKHRRLLRLFAGNVAMVQGPAEAERQKHNSLPFLQQNTHEVQGCH